MKYINKIGMMLVASGMLAATSCTDFNDYNTAVEPQDVTAGKTLWENIKSTSDLSDFAAVIEAVGYDKVLDAPTTYTVWAPVNGSFNKDSVLALAKNPSTKELVKTQFIYDHVANYSHMESNLSDTVVYMLSKKLIKFKGQNSGNLTFDGKTINKANDFFNIPSSNGILYAMKGMVPFRPNAYEFIFTDKSQYGISDSLYQAYVKKYEKVTLDEKASVKGEIVNGLQVYDDSVTIISNSYVRRINADYSNEDSLYTAIIPTDEAWQKAYDRIKGYYNYITPIKFQNLNSTDSKFVGTKGGSTTATNATIMAATVGVDDNPPTLSAPPSDAAIQETKAYWTDSITKLLMTRALAFSHSNKQYNKKLVSGEAFVESDTIRSTNRVKFTNLEYLDKVTVMKQQLSNGNALVVNDFPFYSFESYAPEIKTRSVGRVITASGYGVERMTIDKSVLDPSVCVLEKDQSSLVYVKPGLPANSSVAPELDFYLPDVLSTTYDIYAVMVPGVVEGDTVPRPYTLRFDLHYTDENNVPRAGRFDGTDVLKTTTAELKKVAAFETSGTKVDTVFVGRFTFPICYAGTEAAPNIKVMSTFNTFGATNRKKYDSVLRIASIILKPMDLVEFEKNATKED